MRVVLADPAVTVYGWRADLDNLGRYVQRVRKTPEELKAERQWRLASGKKGKIVPTKNIPGTVIKHSEADPSIVYFLPGSWPRIKAFLDQNHEEYTIEDQRNPAIRPEMALDRLDGTELRENQDVALALISKLDCGIIETTTGWGKSFLIATLCKVYPTLNILICTSSMSVVNTLCEYVNKALPGQCGQMTGVRDTTAGKRIVVSTLRSLAKIKPDNVHLVLIDECHDAGANEAGQALMRFCFARRFGFSASPIRNDGTQKVLEAICGPVILKMTYQESVDAGMVTPMKYAMLHCGTGPSICHKEDLPEHLMKRYAYWANAVRNRQIQQFVYALKKVYDGQILILCSTLEHAIQLGLLLPWFKVAYYGVANMADLKARFPVSRYPNLDLSKYKLTPKQLDITRNAFAKGTLRYVISTTVFRQGVNFEKLQVLIRADGATSEVMGIQIPGRLSRLAENKRFSYLIDVDDAFCPWAKRRAATRAALYDKQQWQRITPEEVLHDLGAESTTDTAEHTGGSDSEQNRLLQGCGESDSNWPR